MLPVCKDEAESNIFPESYCLLYFHLNYASMYIFLAFALKGGKFPTLICITYWRKGLEKVNTFEL